jgi:hypothetical protein
MMKALLVYRKLLGRFDGIGFEVNPYNSCVASKMVNGSQIIVHWHVDDLMISHVDQKKIEGLLSMIKRMYGENWPR